MASREQRNKKVLESTQVLQDKKVRQNIESFLSNAEGIIHKMLELNHKAELLNESRQDEAKQLVNEIIHSIFFLGRINTPRVSPEDIFTDDEYLKGLRGCYPRPFELYSSQLPRRTPFSCVLDMIVFLEGRENENKIKQKLQEIIRELHLKKTEPLVSSTICVSQKNPNSARYYGVSMSTSGRFPGRIMVAASCLPGSWDSCVAGAVMSFTPNKRRNSDFDGTFKLPQHVTCKAYSLHEEEVQPPCKSCKNLFYQGDFEKVTNAYGNCAEVESVSNLFKKDKGVREKARPTSEKFTDENRRTAEESVRAELKSLPKTFKSKGPYEFYNPKGEHIGH